LRGMSPHIEPAGLSSRRWFDDGLSRIGFIPSGVFF
jgi:hypothetical protein